MSRTKGSINKKLENLADTAERIGVDIFEVLCLFAKGDHKALGLKDPLTPDTRLHAVKEAAKYLYSQRRAVELSNSEDTGFKVIIEDYQGKK